MLNVSSEHPFKAREAYERSIIKYDSINTGPPEKTL